MSVFGYIANLATIFTRLRIQCYDQMTINGLNKLMEADDQIMPMGKDPGFDNVSNEKLKFR